MKRLLTCALACALLASLTAARPAAAASVLRTHLYSTGAIVSTGEIRGDSWVSTELSVHLQADSPNGAREPLLWVNQWVSTYDADTGEIGDLVWGIGGQTNTFDVSIAKDLSLATASATDMAVDRCDADGNCESQSISLAARFDGLGPQLRSRQNSVSSVSHQSRFIQNGNGSYRFASATVTIDGESVGPSTDPSDADIYDTRDSSIDATLVPYGTSAPADARIVPFDTSAPGEGVQTGQGVLGSWSRGADGIFVDTFVSGSSRHLLGTGTVSDETLAFVFEQVYSIDEWGNFTTLSETSSVEEARADAVSVDNRLTSGAFDGAAIPAITCTNVGGELACTDTTVSASIAFTGYGKATTTRDGNRAGVAGYWMSTYRNSSTSRHATATGTVDGVNPGTLQEGQIDLFKQGFRTIQIR